MNHDGLGLDFGPAPETRLSPHLAVGPLSGDSRSGTAGDIAALAASAGISRVQMVAWRDLDHPEAGGSELHAARIAERWAAAGMSVILTASRAPDAPATAWRDGYRIERPSGRYGIFPTVGATGLLRAGASGLRRVRLTETGTAGSDDELRVEVAGGSDDDDLHRRRALGQPLRLLPGAGSATADPAELLSAGQPRPAAGRLGTTGPGPDAVVEIWNGMPFFSPLWAGRRRMVFLHHVHGGMWDLVMPRHLAALGRFLESRAAPPIYRHTPVVTLSDSSRRGIIDVLGMRPDQVRVVPPGVDTAFRPARERHPDPLVVAVGRLVTYKRFDLLIESLARLRQRHPTLRAVIAGEGSARGHLEQRIAALGATSWISLPGRVSQEQLIDLYQRAWVLVSTSAFEGWGLTITEAAACATPSVASPIAGHLDAVRDGVTGFLAEPGSQMEDRIDVVLSDPLLRRRMQRAALRHSAPLTWDRTALETLRVLATASPRRDGSVARAGGRLPGR